MLEVREKIWNSESHLWFYAVFGDFCIRVQIDFLHSNFGCFVLAPPLCLETIWMFEILKAHSSGQLPVPDEIYTFKGHAQFTVVAENVGDTQRERVAICLIFDFSRIRLEKCCDRLSDGENRARFRRWKLRRAVGKGWRILEGYNSILEPLESNFSLIFPQFQEEKPMKAIWATWRAYKYYPIIFRRFRLLVISLEIQK